MFIRIGVEKAMLLMEIGWCYILNYKHHGSVYLM